MPRDYKFLVKDNIYHVYNRGHNYQPIFLENQDYRNFFKRLRILLGLPEVSYVKGNLRLRVTPVPKGSFDVLAYCLMPNHFHFLLKQNTDLPISVLINRLCTSYAKYLNAKHGRVGSLFQDTFKAKLVENDAYLAHLSAYIHNNPEDINSPYSSFREYTNKSDICKTDLIMSMFQNNTQAYLDFVIKSKTLPYPLEGD